MNIKLLTFVNSFSVFQVNVYGRICVQGSEAVLSTVGATGYDGMIFKYINLSAVIFNSRIQITKPDGCYLCLKKCQRPDPYKIN
jgi:hypothetical protein